MPAQLIALVIAEHLRSSWRAKSRAFFVLAPGSAVDDLAARPGVHQTSGTRTQE